jgi:hypothetical protein
LIRQIERPALKLATYINAAWPGYKADEAMMKKYGSIAKDSINESKVVMNALMADVEVFKKVSQ